jgi:hypothetical protein
MYTQDTSYLRDQSFYQISSKPILILERFINEIYLPKTWESFMMNDPRLYRDPERFMPERFLGENPERDSRDMAFGFGRRYEFPVFVNLATAEQYQL